jgi:hypothetical protein
MRILCVVVALVGCAKGEQAKPKADPCTAAVDAFAKTMPIKGDKADEKLSNVKALVANRCREDNWNDAARTCMAAATTAEAQRACFYKQLTQEQQDKLNRAVLPVVGSGEEDRDVAAEAMAQMERFKDQMCACKDSACAQRVSDDMTKWSQQLSQTQRNMPKMTVDETKRAAVIGEAMGKCMENAMRVQGLTK